jgi:hypothetical protein
MTELHHNALPRTESNDSLINYAQSFAKSKRAVLDAMPGHVAIGVSCWLSDMLTAAEEGDAARVYGIAERVISRLKDEMAYQLNQQRKDRDRQRG